MMKSGLWCTKIVECVTWIPSLFIQFHWLGKRNIGGDGKWARWPEYDGQNTSVEHDDAWIYMYGPILNSDEPSHWGYLHVCHRLSIIRDYLLVCDEIAGARTKYGTVVYVIIAHIAVGLLSHERERELRAVSCDAAKHAAAP